MYYIFTVTVCIFNFGSVFYSFKINLIYLYVRKFRDVIINKYIT